MISKYLNRIVFPSTVLFLLLLRVSPAKSQSKKFQQEIQKYFISLPYGKKTQSWISEINNNKFFQPDSISRSDTLTEVILKGRINNPNALFSEADSVLIQIRQKIADYKQYVNGVLMVDNRKYLPYLQQMFYFPKQSVSKQEWEIIYNKMISDLDKVTYVQYPKVYDHGYAQPLQTILFYKTGRPDPVIVMLYGESMKSESYVLILTLFPASSAIY